MIFRIGISEPLLLADLAWGLRESDCAVSEISDRMLEVTHVSARSDREARMDVFFFLRSWQLAHPSVDVVLA